MEQKGVVERMKLEEAPKTKNGREGWKDVIEAFAEKTGLTYEEARFYFYSWCECLAEKILTRGRLNLPHVGTFRVSYLAEHKVGRSIRLATYMLRFKATQGMKRHLREAFLERKFER